MRTRSAAAALLLAAAMAAPAGAAPGAFDHGAWDAILAGRVQGDRLDYLALRSQDGAAFAAYLESLGAAGGASLPTEADRIAFWINAYNAFTVKGVLDNYPLRSIRDVRGFWDKTKYRALGREVTLDEIEHEILRKQFREPRIHFAIVCASLSCPRLQPFAFTGAKLGAQLDRARDEFLADPRRNRADAARRTLYLSKIFDWFGDDFEKYLDQTPKAYAAAHLPAPIPSGDLEKWDVEYLDYDWRLNIVPGAEDRNR